MICVVRSLRDGFLRSTNVSSISPLLDRGADVHTQGDWALRLTIEKGNYELVRLLLDRGADVHT